MKARRGRNGGLEPKMLKRTGDSPAMALMRSTAPLGKRLLVGVEPKVTGQLPNGAFDPQRTLRHCGHRFLPNMPRPARTGPLLSARGMV
jgi:hypothetical protein